MRISAQRLCDWIPVLLVALVLSLLVLGPLATQASETTLRWELRDGSGGRWGLVLFEQPDPALPHGWRLRLLSRDPGLQLDHRRSLQIDDGMGGHWQLANCSQELVAKADDDLPDQAAQFDAEGLWPRPQAALPLQVLIPLAGRDAPGAGAAALVLGPEPVAALHGLPPRQDPEAAKPAG